MSLLKAQTHTEHLSLPLLAPITEGSCFCFELVRARNLLLSRRLTQLRLSGPLFQQELLQVVHAHAGCAAVHVSCSFAFPQLKEQAIAIVSPMAHTAQLSVCTPAPPCSPVITALHCTTFNFRASRASFQNPAPLGRELRHRVHSLSPAGECSLCSVPRDSWLGIIALGHTGCSWLNAN